MTLKLKTFVLCTLIASPALSDEIIVNYTGTVTQNYSTNSSYFHKGATITGSFNIDIYSPQDYFYEGCQSTYSNAITSGQIKIIESEFEIFFKSGGLTLNTGQWTHPSYEGHISVNAYLDANNFLVDDFSIFTMNINAIENINCNLNELDSSILIPRGTIDLNLNTTAGSVHSTITIDSFTIELNNCPDCTSPIEDQLNDITERVVSTKAALKTILADMDAIDVSIKEIEQTSDIDVSMELIPMKNAMGNIAYKAKWSSDNIGDIEESAKVILETTLQ